MPFRLLGVSSIYFLKNNLCELFDGIKYANCMELKLMQDDAPSNYLRIVTTSRPMPLDVNRSEKEVLICLGKCCIQHLGGQFDCCIVK